MVVCNCGQKIEYFVVVANRPFSSQNHTERPIIVGDGSYFLCDNCAKNTVQEWRDHNRGRTEQYLIETVKVNVIADTKKLFVHRARPQLYTHFKKINWWLPKSDIEAATKILKKVKNN